MGVGPALPWGRTDAKKAMDELGLSQEGLRKLIKEEGLLVGGSSGTATWAALQAASSLKENENCFCTHHT